MHTHMELIEALATAEPSKGSMRCVAVVGVDKFSRLRAAIGYDLAERLVAELAHVLKSVDRNPKVARLAPDALGFVFEVDQQSAVSDLGLAQLVTALERPIYLDGHRLHVGIRIGFAVSEGAISARDLLHQAEMALDQARERSVSLHRFSIEEFGDPLSRLALLDDLREGIERDELELYYQPQLNARTGEVVSSEALMRWQCPKRGLVPPDHFIQPAEETGLIRELTLWAVRRAMRDAARMRVAGFPLRVGVNISSPLLCDAVFCNDVLALLADCTDGITFEITESAAINDWAHALDSLRKFAAMGVRLAIDDYGSGMSSLAYIQQLPAQELKIDRQFITQMTVTHRDPLLVRSTIELGHALEMEVVAEGIQDAATLALLTMMGCDVVQGYFIGKPMPLSSFLSYLKAETGKSKVGARLNSEQLLAHFAAEEA